MRSALGGVRPWLRVGRGHRGKTLSRALGQVRKVKLARWLIPGSRYLSSALETT